MQFTIVRGLVSNPRLLTLVAETLTYPRKNARQKEPTLRCGLPGAGPGSVTDVTFPNALGYPPSKLQRAKAGAANEP
jgi:hypothetical protein